MTSVEKKKLRKIIMKNARLFNMRVQTKEKFCMKEDYHLFTYIENEIFRWEIQITICCAAENRIHSMLFLHPVLITPKTRSEYIKFANAANWYLSSAMGRFWVDDSNDFCYESYLPLLLLEYEHELENQLFDLPFAHFRDCLSPLMKTKDGEWDSQVSIKFLTELRENGYIKNEDYGI